MVRYRPVERLAPLAAPGLEFVDRRTHFITRVGGARRVCPRSTSVLTVSFQTEPRTPALRCRGPGPVLESAAAQMLA